MIFHWWANREKVLIKQIMLPVNINTYSSLMFELSLFWLWKRDVTSSYWIMTNLSYKCKRLNENYTLHLEPDRYREWGDYSRRAFNLCEHYANPRLMSCVEVMSALYNVRSKILTLLNTTSIFTRTNCTCSRIGWTSSKLKQLLTIEYVGGLMAAQQLINWTET